MESAPQLVLQLYIMVTLETWQSWTGECLFLSPSIYRAFQPCLWRKFSTRTLTQNLYRHYQMWHSEDHAVWYILIIKPTRCSNFSNLFWNRTLHVLDGFSVHHQESSTVHTAVGICHTGYADCLLVGSGWNWWNQFHPDPTSKQSA